MATRTSKALEQAAALIPDSIVVERDGPLDLSVSLE
jgi:hypothetical protein